MKKMEKKKVLDLFPTRYWNPLKLAALLDWTNVTPDNVYRDDECEVYVLKDDGEAEVSFEKVSSSYILDRIQDIVGLKVKKGISVYIPKDLSRKKVSGFKNSVRKVTLLRKERKPFVIADERKGIVEIYGEVETRSEKCRFKEPFKATFCLEPRRLLGFLEYRGKTKRREVPLEDLFTEEELEKMEKEGIKFSVASSPLRG